ncbi:MAG: SMP-30/gluconolactonase/LRE family protein [Syntrophales bacterium]|nr:SMP-30/gluconolactonase/LRE family protein [Syntrophales bacterium]
MVHRSVRLFADGFKFPEGPAFDRDGNLFVVNVDTGDISEISPEGRVETFVNTRGAPNGAKFHANGDLYIADRKKGIVAVSPTGKMRVIVDHYQGQKLNGPNDLIFDSSGNLYFTDPHGSSAENPHGCVYCVSSGGEMTCLASGLAFPNGLALSLDEKYLFVADTRKNRILRYVLDPPVRSYLFSQLSGGWGPDGIAFDTAENLYVAQYGGGAVIVLNPKGELIERIDVGGLFPTNVAFGGADGRTLYMTEVETGSVYFFRTEFPGLPLFGTMGTG